MLTAGLISVHVFHFGGLRTIFFGFQSATKANDALVTAPKTLGGSAIINGQRRDTFLEVTLRSITSKLKSLLMST